MKYLGSLTLVLSGIWLLLSGHFENPVLLTLGFLSVLLVVFLARRMGVADEEGAPIEPAFRFLLYVPWLLLEVAKANLDVARIVLSPRMPISPRLIRIRASQRTDLGRTLYANSITLTPGTVSMVLDKDEITVHALTAEAAAGVESGEMDRRAKRVEGTR